MKKYYIPTKEIELIIDNGLAKKSVHIGKIKVISFNQYLEEKEHYTADKFVVGANVRFLEIKNQLIEQAHVSEENIVYIDDWIKVYGVEIDNYLNQEAGECAKNYINNLISEMGDIPKESLINTKVLRNREQVCELIPKDSIVAEIGVAFGGFSKTILDNISPSKFYAIDIFNEKTKGFWGQNTFENEKISHFEWYAKKFKDFIEKGILKMQKGLSWECLDIFPDNYFDYVYLDAAHDYESVKKDITVLKRVVKNKGIIQFNDYTHCDWYGVIPAVHELIKDTNSKVLYYCLSPDGYDDIVIQLHK